MLNTMEAFPHAELGCRSLQYILLVRGDHCVCDCNRRWFVFDGNCSWEVHTWCHV